MMSKAYASDVGMKWIWKLSPKNDLSECCESTFRALLAREVTMLGTTHIPILVPSLWALWWHIILVAFSQGKIKGERSLVLSLVQECACRSRWRFGLQWRREALVPASCRAVLLEAQQRSSPCSPRARLPSTKEIPNTSPYIKKRLFLLLVQRMWQLCCQCISREVHLLLEGSHVMLLWSPGLESFTQQWSHIKLAEFVC